MSRGTNEVLVSVDDLEPPPHLGPYRRFCLKLLAGLRLRGVELSVLLTSDRRMRELNRRHRGLDRTTDVLSFEQDQGGEGSRGEGARPLGDVVISMPAVQRNARRYGAGVEQELRRVTIHGLLHLRGFDHRRAAERARMTALEDALVGKTQGEKVT